MNTDQKEQHLKAIAQILVDNTPEEQLRQGTMIVEISNAP